VLVDNGPANEMEPVTGWWSILRPVFLHGLGIRK
jgi:hypothetical protein